MLTQTLAVAGLDDAPNSTDWPRYIAFYAGPGSPTALVDIARLWRIKMAPEWIGVLALNQRIWTDHTSFAVEVEGQAVKHFEQADLFSFNGAFVLRWLRTPWHRLLRGTFAFGNGLSYATGIPQMEARTIPVTSELLYYLLIELSFPISPVQPWELFFRVHHRSGVFGLFNNVVGGSDFLCLGVKYRF